MCRGGCDTASPVGAVMGESLIGSRHSGSLELKTAQIGRAPTSNDIRSETETKTRRGTRDAMSMQARNVSCCNRDT